MVDADLRHPGNTPPYGNSTDRFPSNSTLSNNNTVGAVLRALLGTNPFNTNETKSSNSTECDEHAVPGCRQCCNAQGTCCPDDYECDSNGKCPQEALVAMGYILNGINIVAARNLSDGTEAPDDSVDPRARGFIGVDLDENDGQTSARFGTTYGEGAESAEVLDPNRKLAKREREFKEKKVKDKELVKRLMVETQRETRHGFDSRGYGYLRHHEEPKRNWAVQRDVEVMMMGVRTGNMVVKKEEMKREEKGEGFSKWHMAEE